MIDGALPWSYETEVLKRIKTANSLLDIGTGGGELLSMMTPLPKDTCATEGYKPNVPIARKRLEPLGVKVYQTISARPLVFKNGRFDLVINRHGGYPNLKEILRVLRTGGLFISQNVGDQYNIKLNRLLGAGVESHVISSWNLKVAVKELQNLGMKILIQREAFPMNRFYDIGAVVYYLKAIPWQLKGFSVKKYRGDLFKLHKRMLKEGYIDIPAHNFLIIAQK